MAHRVIVFRWNAVFSPPTRFVSLFVGGGNRIASDCHSWRETNMIHTIARFAGLPLAVAAAAITISAASASAQVAVDVAPKLDVDLVVTQCSIETLGYGQFQACVKAAFTP
jgi:hypothetical protein